VLNDHPEMSPARLMPSLAKLLYAMSHCNFYKRNQVEIHVTIPIFITPTSHRVHMQSEYPG